MFTGGRPLPLPSWGDGVARKDLDKMQSLCENLQQLRQEGLTGMHLLWTFFSCWIQPLQRQRTKMWVYPGSSCPDCPTSEELSPVEVEAQIHKVMDLEVNLNPDPYLVHLRRGIVSAAFTIRSFHYTHNPA
jgi:hypothetical protein